MLYKSIYCAQIRCKFASWNRPIRESGDVRLALGAELAEVDRSASPAATLSVWRLTWAAGLRVRELALSSFYAKQRKLYAIRKQGVLSREAQVSRRDLGRPAAGNRYNVPVFPPRGRSIG